MKGMTIVTTLDLPNAHNQLAHRRLTLTVQNSKIYPNIIHTIITIYNFGFPFFSPSLSAPLSSFVGSLSLVSAFKLTGSPSCEGLPLFSFCSARSLSVFSPLPSCVLSLWEAPVSSGVGLVSEVSARREMGSPSCEGFFEEAMSLRLLLF